MTPSRKNKQDRLPDHSREKILVYKTYLENYLSVMCNHLSWKNIHIWEPFAGPGIYKNGDKGSPVEAAEVVYQVLKEKNPGAKIRSFVNERDSDSFVSLKEALKSFDFVRVDHDDAEKFVQKAHEIILRCARHQTHNLIFIDPYGYTQISHESLKNLLRLPKVDCLIFIPTNHVYRFHDPSKGDYKPARKFLLDLGISEKNLADIDHVNKLEKEMVDVLKRIADAKYGYSHKLTNKDAISSQHHLFFVSRHPRGAEKFLETIKKVGENKEIQLDFLLRPSIEQAIRSILADGELDNKKFYEGLLVSGYLSANNEALRSVLKELKGQKIIEVQDANGKINPNGYWLDLNQKHQGKRSFRLLSQE